MARHWTMRRRTASGLQGGSRQPAYLEKGQATRCLHDVMPTLCRTQSMSPPLRNTLNIGKCYYSLDVSPSQTMPYVGIRLIIITLVAVMACVYNMAGNGLVRAGHGPPVSRVECH